MATIQRWLGSNGPRPMTCVAYRGSVDGRVHRFVAQLEIIVGNPFVLLPATVLDDLFVQAARNKSPIPVRGSINGQPYQQTLMKYDGAWRLYVNLKMLADSPRRIGEPITVEITFDPSDRTIAPHPKFTAALAANRQAREVFENLTPSKQKEIVRYIAALKTEQSVDRNVARATEFLLGNARFVGRDKP